MPEPLQAHIHHFFPHPDTGEVQHDEFDEPMIGFYFQIVNRKGQFLGYLTGPYRSAEEAEEACQEAYASGDYDYSPNH